MLRSGMRRATLIGGEKTFVGFLLLGITHLPDTTRDALLRGAIFASTSRPLLIAFSRPPISAHRQGLCAPMKNRRRAQAAVQNAHRPPYVHR